jgi:predicted ester cyclase
MGAAADLVVHQLHLVDQHDHAGAAAYETEDCEYVTPFASLHGPDAIRAAREVLANGFPDAHHEILNVVDAAPDVVVEATWTGTHTGPLVTPQGEIPPTGKGVAIPMAVVAHVEDDCITSTHIYYDNIALLNSLGLIPSPG